MMVVGAAVCGKKSCVNQLRISPGVQYSDIANIGMVKVIEIRKTI